MQNSFNGLATDDTRSLRQLAEQCDAGKAGGVPFGSADTVSPRPRITRTLTVADPPWYVPDWVDRALRDVIQWLGSLHTELRGDVDGHLDAVDREMYRRMDAEAAHRLELELKLEEVLKRLRVKAVKVPESKEPEHWELRELGE